MACCLRHGGRAQGQGQVQGQVQGQGQGLLKRRRQERRSVDELWSRTMVTVTRSGPSVQRIEATDGGETLRLVDALLERTATMIQRPTTTHNNTSHDDVVQNVVAYSGGVDSSLVAALVHRVTMTSGISTDTTQAHEQAQARAVLGVSPAVPDSQMDIARRVAAHIGIPLTEISTTEGTDATYIANQGQACLACKTHLYSALQAVAHHASSSVSHTTHDDDDDDDDGIILPNRGFVLFNGTNKDDTKDPTRLGLIAAANFSVESPLMETIKHDVRRAARHFGLENWNYAAAPCLRSRLAFGVEASQQHLQQIEQAESWVRRVLQLDWTANLRVRLLSKERAMIELDSSLLHAQSHAQHDNNTAQDRLEAAGLQQVFQDIGIGKNGCGIRAFQSGAVATLVIPTPPTENNKNNFARTEEKEENERKEQVANLQYH